MDSPKGLSPVQALDVFFRGFCFTRSLTHPFITRQINSTLWVLEEGHGRKRNPRNSEVVAYNATLEETLATIPSVVTGRYILCIFVVTPEEIAPTCAAYKGFGYRLLGKEPLFVLSLPQQKIFQDYPIQRVTNATDIEAIKRATRRHMLPTKYLTATDVPMRLYAAFDATKAVGWVTSIRATEQSCWVSSLHVDPNYRRRGIGKSLMSAMLQEDAHYGAEHSVLLASQTGALLYPHLGYESVGTLLLFAPPKAEKP